MHIGIKLPILLEQNCVYNYLFNLPNILFYFYKIFLSFHTDNKPKKNHFLPVKSMQVFILSIFYVNLCKAKSVFREDTQ